MQSRGTLAIYDAIKNAYRKPHAQYTLWVNFKVEFLSELSDSS